MSFDLESAKKDLPVDLSLTDHVLPAGCRGIYVGVAGNLDIELIETAVGTHRVYKNVVAGAVYPFQIRKVYRTTTTATDLIALY